MTQRTVPLTAIKQGIDRLRPKAGSRADSLYDLVNGFVTAERTVQVRPGTRRVANLTAGTKGLVAFNSLYYVFATTSIDLSAFPLFRLIILLHPFDPAATLTKIHYAAPFLGALYVTAGYSDGKIYHFWLQAAVPWQASHEYSANVFVTPTTPNGYVYIGTRLSAPFPAWTAGAPRTLGPPASVIEPTTYNEYYYTAIAVAGTNPSSGGVEPDWPLATGATIVESTDGFNATTNNDANPPASPAPTPQASTTDRYNR